jgi:mono/diheme cytochrome c family protein
MKFSGLGAGEIASASFWTPARKSREDVIRVHRPENRFSRFSKAATGILFLAWVIIGVPAVRSAASQDAGQAAPPAPAGQKPVELPEGDGKAIATEYCQDCHRLTNLTKAHKSLDDWKDTVQTMIDRGANVPADKVDTLVKYLAKNFGPADSPAPASTPAQ